MNHSAPVGYWIPFISSRHMNTENENQAQNQADSRDVIFPDEARPIRKTRVRKIQAVRGYLNKCSSSGTWRRRWFVLSKGRLSIFKKKTDTKARGALKVSGGKVFLDDGDGSDSQFSVISSDGSSFLLHARNALDARQWCIALEAAARAQCPATDDSERRESKGNANATAEAADMSHLPLLLVLELVGNCRDSRCVRPLCAVRYLPVDQLLKRHAACVG